MAGPALARFIWCGISFFILRALGENSTALPAAASSLTPRFLGEKSRLRRGLDALRQRAMTGIVDITAVALYMHYWRVYDVPRWVFAPERWQCGTMNMIGVKGSRKWSSGLRWLKCHRSWCSVVIRTVFLGSGKPLDGNANRLPPDNR